MSDDQRVVELEAELLAAHRTIEALVARAEAATWRGRVPAAGTEPDSALLLAQALDEREREVGEARAELSAAQSEFRALTANLDQIVKQRTRALAASEAQLRQKNRELESQSSLKAEFISIVAHELRTPLTSIVGYLDLFAEGKFGEAPSPMVRPLNSVRRNAHRLKRLVDEMLDVSRIEAGRVRLLRAQVDLADIVRDVATELSPLAQARQQKVHAVCDSIDPVWADRDKLYQVVVNLLSNAIRYSHDGGDITMKVQEAPRDKYPDGWVCFSVLDHGIGIAEEHRSKIFEPFYDIAEAKNHTSTGPGSSGLGLYIARGLVELHGGLITVDSVVGKQTEFTVLLPRQELSQQ